MFTSTKVRGRHLVRKGKLELAMKPFLIAASVAILLATAGSATAEVFIHDYFGSTNDLGDGTLTRHDAAGNTVFMGGGQKGPTLIGIDGIRAQIPDTSAEVWHAPGGQHAATWFFASSSTDPFEPVTPGDVNNLTLVAGADAGTGGHLAALLPFTPPASSYKVSADMIPEGGDLRDWVGIGLTSSLDTLNNNFESFGQAWLMIRMNATGLGPTTWELHTNGMTGPSLSGSTVFTGSYIPLELAYDPVAHLVSGSINGIPTPTISYAATGISGVGMEAVEHISFGLADNFIVQTGAILRGDFNQDRHLDARDISAMMTALSDLNAYKLAHGFDDPQVSAIGDVNGDGIFNNGDLQALINVLKSGGGSMNSVPEPPSSILALTIFAALGGLKHLTRNRLDTSKRVLRASLLAPDCKYASKNQQS